MTTRTLVVSSVLAFAACSASMTGLDERRVEPDAPLDHQEPLPPADHDGDPTGMVLVPAGPFRMGVSTPQGNLDERPEHEVTVAAFWIDRTEVTVEAYRSCARAGACMVAEVGLERFSLRAPVRNEQCTYRDDGAPRQPMTCITWREAALFCRFLGKRLPSEAEWEKAARGATDARMFPWGDTVPSNRSKRFANLADVSAKAAYPSFSAFDGYDDGAPGVCEVGSYPAGDSPFGVADMVGNVLEWTADGYDASAYLKVATGETPAAGATSYRIARGAAWDSDPRTVRITRRWPLLATDRMVSLGFRCAMDARLP